jgi:hypothetical protein
MPAIDNLKVLADWGRDTSYSHALSDLTSRVQRLEWKYGFEGSGQLVAQPAQGVLTLDNSDGAFNVGRSGGLYAGLLQRDVLIKVVHSTGASGTPYTLITLRVVDIQIAPNAFGERRVNLILEDWHAELMSMTYDPPLTLSARTDQAVSSAFTAGLLPLPYAGYWWVVGGSTLGTDSKLYASTGYLSANTGDTTLDYVGNNIDEQGRGVNLFSFIEEMCAAEMDGRFWYETDHTTGKPRYVYIGRNTIATNAATLPTSYLPASAFINASSGYESGRVLCNSVEVTLYPRRVGTPGTELWRNGTAFKLKAGENRELTARYRDPDFPDGTCSATTIIAPVATTDYTGNSAKDGTGTNLTANLAVALENNTSSARLIITNTSAVDVWVTLIKLRGTPLTARTPVTLKTASAPSIHRYGLQRQMKTIAGVDDVDLVQTYADLFVGRYKDTVSRYASLTFEFPSDSSDPLWQAAFYSPATFNPVRIMDEWLEDAATTRPQWISGVRHVVNPATRRWSVTWTLEDLSTTAYWIFGNSTLGTLGVSTRLGF